MTLSRVLAPTFAVGLALLGCGGGGEAESEGGLGRRVGEAVADTQVMKEAEAAANRVIRNATDCDAVRAAIGDVRAKLDAVAARVETETGRTALATLRKQVDTVAEACGVP